MPIPKLITDFDDVKRLILQVERDLVAPTRLKRLLLDGGATVADHRQELRTAKGRIRRARRGKGWSARR